MVKGKVTKTSGLTEVDRVGLIKVEENNAKIIEKAIDSALVRAMEKIGLLAEGYAKRLCPVDTGRLRNSITHALGKNGKEVYIGTNVEYGRFVELGTRKRKGANGGRGYLRPAATEHGQEYRRVLENELKNG